MSRFDGRLASARVVDQDIKRDGDNRDGIEIHQGYHRLRLAGQSMQALARGFDDHDEADRQQGSLHLAAAVELARQQGGEADKDEGQGK